MVIKILFITLFGIILISLGKALYHLVRQSETPDKKTVNALTIRIALSILLFILVALAILSGLLKPHGIGANIHASTVSKKSP
jgi:H+/Cl- antiporter ClcA